MNDHPLKTRKVFVHYVHAGEYLSREFDFRRHVERNEYVRFASWATSHDVEFVTSTRRGFHRVISGVTGVVHAIEATTHD